MSDSVDVALQEAIKDFQGALTPDQKRRLHTMKVVPDAAAVITLTAQLDGESQKRQTPGVSGRLYILLQSIQQFSSVVDTFVQSNPAIAALVWGSVKLTILVASNITSYLDRLSDLFMKFTKLCPRFDEYRVLYPQSTRLQRAICDFHASIIRCCKHALLVIDRTWTTQLISAFKRSFQTEFEPFQAEIKACSKEVQAQIDLAQAQAAYQDRQLSLQERAAASSDRKFSKLFYGEFVKSNKDFMSWRIQKDQRQAAKRRQHLLNHLSTYDHHAAFRQARKKRHGQTAQWLMRMPDFNSWLHDNANVLWCSGKLGSGKTILTAAAIDHVFLQKSAGDVCIVFFFCRFDEPTSLTWETILRSIIRQFFGSDELPSDAKHCLESLSNKPSADVEELQDLLRKRIAAFKTSYIIVDALDECEKSECKVILDVFQSIIISNISRVKILLTGRDTLGELIKTRFKSLVQVSMGCPDAQVDIASYVKEVTELRLKDGDLIVGNVELVSEIQKALIDGAQGMFLWVAFQMNELCAQCTDQEIRQALRDLPKSLTEIFHRALLRAKANSNAKLANRVFQWVAAAKRPLALAELREALSIEPGQLYLEPERFANDMHRVIACCQNLVVFDREEETVHFAHHTVKQYFTKRQLSEEVAEFQFELSDVNHEIGEICVTYLDFNDFKTQLIQRPKPQPSIIPMAIAETALGNRSYATKMPSSVRSAMKRSFRGKGRADVAKSLARYSGNNDKKCEGELYPQYSFQLYATTYWLAHTSDFEKGKSRVWKTWARLLSDEQCLGQTPWTHDQFVRRDDVLVRWIYKQHHAALLRLVCSSGNTFDPAVVGTMFREIAHEYGEEMGEKSMLPFILDVLQAASVAADSWACEVLYALLYPSLLKADGLHGLLFSAAKEGYQETATMLIRAGVISIPVERGNTALHSAVLADSPPMVQLLLAAGADVNEIDPVTSMMPLHHAAGRGCQGVVEKLLDAGANIDAPDNGGFSPLLYAISLDQPRIAQILLAAHAESGSNKSGFTPLTMAIVQMGTDMVKTLLAANASTEATGKGGYTPLHVAILENKPEIVKILLAANASTEVTEKNNSTPLHTAAAGGNPEIDKMLLAARANVEATDSDGVTPLLRAVWKNRPEIVKMLLAAGANVEATDPDGVTPLLEALWENKPEIVKMLLAAGANVEATDKCGRSTLHRAAVADETEMVEMLLAAKANVEAIDQLGNNPLHVAVLKNRPKTVKVLLTANSNIEAVGQHGHTPLHMAILENKLEIVKILLAANADVHARPHNGLSSLKLATADGCHKDIAKQLLAAGARLE